MIRRLVLTVVAAVLASPAAGADRPAIREQSEKVVEAAGLRGLDVNNPRGLISVRPSRDGKVHVTALKVVRGGETTQGRELAEQTRVEAGVEGDRYVVRVRYPQRRQISIGFWDLIQGGEIPRVEVRLAFEVPAGFEVALKSTSGDVATDALSGMQKLESTSGDVQVGTALGTVAATTTSGDIDLGEVARARVASVSGDVRVDRARGALSVSTTSGEIAIEAADDSLRVATVSGDVRVHAARRGLNARSTSGEIVASVAGSVAAESTSGDVRVTFDRPLGATEIATLSGDIETHFAADLGCMLDLRTNSGSIDVTVPFDMQTVTRRRVAGRVGRGSTPVVLRSSSGDIHVGN